MAPDSTQDSIDGDDLYIQETTMNQLWSARTSKDVDIIAKPGTSFRMKKDASAFGSSSILAPSLEVKTRHLSNSWSTKVNHELLRLDKKVDDEKPISTNGPKRVSGFFRSTSVAMKKTGNAVGLVKKSLNFSRKRDERLQRAFSQNDLSTILNSDDSEIGSSLPKRLSMDEFVASSISIFRKRDSLGSSEHMPGRETKRIEPLPSWEHIPRRSPHGVESPAKSRRHSGSPPRRQKSLSKLDQNSKDTCVIQVSPARTQVLDPLSKSDHTAQLNPTRVSGRESIASSRRRRSLKSRDTLSSSEHLPRRRRSEEICSFSPRGRHADGLPAYPSQRRNQSSSDHVPKTSEKEPVSPVKKIRSSQQRQRRQRDSLRASDHAACVASKERRARLLEVTRHRPSSLPRKSRSLSRSNLFKQSEEEADKDKFYESFAQEIALTSSECAFGTDPSPDTEIDMGIILAAEKKPSEDETKSKLKNPLQMTIKTIKNAVDTKRVPNKAKTGLSITNVVGLDDSYQCDFEATDNIEERPKSHCNARNNFSPMMRSQSLRDLHVSKARRLSVTGIRESATSSGGESQGGLQKQQSMQNLRSAIARLDMKSPRVGQHNLPKRQSTRRTEEKKPSSWKHLMYEKSPKKPTSSGRKPRKSLDLK